MAKQEKATQTKRGLSAGIKAVFAVVAMGAAVLFGGCKNETNPLPIVYNVSLGTKQIRVEDTTGLADKAEIQEVLDLLESSLSANHSIVHFKSMNTSPIMIIESTHNFRVEDSKFFIGIDKLGGNGSDITSDIYGSILGAIWDIYWGDGEGTPGTPLMSKLSTKEIITFGKLAAQRRMTPFLDKA
jgi:hypothetical protein